MSANQKVNLLPGDYLFREGETARYAYVLKSGSIEIVKMGVSQVLEGRSSGRLLFKLTPELLDPRIRIDL